MGQVNLITPQLFDTVELLKPLDNATFAAGARAAIVEQYDDHHFELEFVNDAGDTDGMIDAHAQDFIVVWRHETEQPITDAERVAQLIERLPQQKARSVLDFAYFLSDASHSAPAVNA